MVKLTDDILLNYKRCRRRSYLDVYGDPSQRDGEHGFLQKLRSHSRNHQLSVLSNLVTGQPYHLSGNSGDRLVKTLDLMIQGADCIVDGVLSHGDLLTSPDVLLKQPGQSVWGDWLYLPVSIKLGKRPKSEYQIILAYQAYVLSLVQGALPTEPWLILRGRSPHRVDLAKWLPLMQTTLTECLQTLSQTEVPELFISRQKCGLCHWHSSCYGLAKQKQHLSLLAGVTPSRYQQLLNLGLTTKEQIAQVPLEQLSVHLGHGVAQTLIKQAQAVVENRAINKKFIPLPDHEVELYFDIEAEPELNLDYLLGVLVVDHARQTRQFHPFLAESPEAESVIWQQFLGLVRSYPQAYIYHFSEYEAETVCRLAHLYGLGSSELQWIRSHMVDLHTHVVNSVILPIEGYSLKQIAKWLGFQWRNPDITGADCVCLYDRWLETGDRQCLQKIIAYNEDDCQATYHLKTWLSSFRG